MAQILERKTVLLVFTASVGRLDHDGKNYSAITFSRWFRWS